MYGASDASRDAFKSHAHHHHHGRHASPELAGFVPGLQMARTRAASSLRVVERLGRRDVLDLVPHLVVRHARPRKDDRLDELAALC